MRLITLFFFFLTFSVASQTGNGHDPDETLSYINHKMRQDNNGEEVAEADNIINNSNAAKLYVNFTFDTTGKNVYLQYTVDCTTPNKSNGNTIAATFDYYSGHPDYNRTFDVLLPLQSAGTSVNYVFYISNGDLASSWGMVDSGSGYVTSWNEDEESITPFSYNVFSEISSDTTWDANTTLSETRYELTSSATLTVENNDVSIDDLSIYNYGSLVIDPSGSMDIIGTLTNNGTIIMQSSSSTSAALKATSISGSGTYKYQKYVAGSSTNDLITAPFSGETFSNLVGNNSGVLVTNTSPTTEYLFGPFDNVTGEYLTYDSTTNASTALSAGQGYRAGTASGATLEFTGDFQTTNQTVAINVGSHGTYGKWNLVGNPFPSYLDLDGFLDDNDTGVLEDVNTAVYAYDGDVSDGWTIYSLNETSNVKIAPGQAFFVASSSGVGNLNFNTSRQTVTGGDDFLPRKAQTLDSSFKLNLESSNSLTHTDVYFNSNASEGLDIGYDVGTYANLASSFSLYSKLASGEYFETNFAIQAISNDLSETVVIPLGVHTSAGESHSISIDDVSLLESINVYLKDYETGTLTLLNNGAYSFSTDSTLEGTSRFELRLTNTTLGIESDELITNFKAVYQNDAVVLVGDFNLDDKVEIYDIMGRLTQAHTIKGNHSIEISKDELATGVYLAKINRDGNSKTIKFIIN